MLRHGEMGAIVETVISGKWRCIVVEGLREVYNFALHRCVEITLWEKAERDGLGGLNSVTDPTDDTKSH